MLPVSFMLFCISVFFFLVASHLQWQAAHFGKDLAPLQVVDLDKTRQGEEQSRANIHSNTVCTVHLHLRRRNKLFWRVFAMTSGLSDAANILCLTALY